MKRLTNDIKLGFQDSNKLPSYESLYDKLRFYELLESKLQGLYKSNEVGIELLVNMFIKQNEEIDKEPYKGYRILTNDDALLYDKWKTTITNK